MQKTLSPVARLLGDRRGVTALEYGLMAALIVLVTIGGVKQIGLELLALCNMASYLP